MMEQSSGKSRLKSATSTAIATVSLLVLDVLVYGEIFPLLGLYVGNKISARFNLPLVAELFLVIGSAFLLFFAALALRCEKSFWKKLYALETFFTCILYVRDTINLAVVAYHVASLVTGLVSARSPPTAIARSTILQHPVTAFRDVACTRAEAYRITRFVSSCSAEKTALFSGAGYEVQFEENILWATAYLTVAISKMLYFNTLFTYLQTLKMFREIQLSSERQREEQVQGIRRRRAQRAPGTNADSDNTNNSEAPRVPPDGAVI